VKVHDHLVEFDGKPVAAWMIPRLKFARENGWDGHVLSGYRTPAQQRGAGARYAKALGKRLEQVYPNGVLASNHVGAEWPRGAVDVTDPVKLAAAMVGWRLAGRPRALVWGGPIINDDAHFSSNGH
jgi:hypothetical protein